MINNLGFRIPDIDRMSTNAVYALVFTGAQEMAQFIGLNPGIFDPLDFLANGVVILVAMAIDYLIQFRRRAASKA